MTLHALNWSSRTPSPPAATGLPRVPSAAILAASIAVQAAMALSVPIRTSCDGEGAGVPLMVILAAIRSALPTACATL